MVLEHTYKGTDVLIEEAIIQPLKKLLIEYCPRLIIELGTYKGGFTKYLSDWFLDIPIYTLDFLWMISKEDQDYLRNKKNVNIIITQDIFNNNLILPILLTLPLKKFFFCDNGFKIEVVKLYAGFLRPGDLLAVHDWDFEIKHSDIWHILQEFEPHEINKKFSQPGASSMRLWIKKFHKCKSQIVKAYNQE